MGSGIFVSFFSSSKEFEECLIVATKTKYTGSPIAWAFPKNSPYLDIFNFYIYEFIENGQWDSIQNEYEPKPQVCLDLSGKPIEISITISAFLYLFGGLFFALIVWIFECAIHMYYEQ